MEGYQMSIDEIILSKTIGELPGRTAYIDESGNFGFDFSKPNVSTHYVVCAVIANNNNIATLEQQVEAIRKQNFGTTEMKSSTIASNHKRRQKVLTDLLMLDIQFVILIAHKQKFYEGSPLAEYKIPFKRFLNQRLYKSMYNSYPKLRIVEDEYGTSEFQEGYKKYVREHRPQLNLLDEYDFDYVNSRHSVLVQVADIIAGSVMQHLNDLSAPDVLTLFSGRITDIVNFPETYTLYNPSAAMSEYDAAIYQLACKCANDYINDHFASDEEPIRLRVLFLRHLMYKLHMAGDSSYMYADEIVRALSAQSEKRITRDYLYRQIVAPLRDAGVVIASSSHGYKIPTKVADISAYINQTVTITGPMLSRVGKCRNKIRQATDGKLDILDDSTLVAYKRYFGDY